MSCDEGDCDLNVCCCLCVLGANACGEGEQATLGGGPTGATGRDRADRADQAETMTKQAALEEPLRAQLPPLYVAMERS